MTRPEILDTAKACVCGERGQWLHPTEESDPLWHLCSICGKGQNQKFDLEKRRQDKWCGNLWFYPFCPFCGAKMDGDA